MVKVNLVAEVTSVVTIDLVEKKASKSKLKRLKRIETQAAENKEAREAEANIKGMAADEPEGSAIKTHFHPPVHPASKQRSVGRLLRVKARKEEDARLSKLSPAERFATATAGSPGKMPYSSEEEAAASDPGFKKK